MKSADIAVSVIIPCFNDGRFLLEAVQSAEQNQQGRHEIIVVNDGSTERATLDVLAAIQQRGHQVLHQPNRGLGCARNRGISAAQGRYILPLDADNRIRAAYLDRGIEILDCDPGVDVVYGDAEYFGGKTGRNRVPDFDLRRLLIWNYIDACAVFRKSAWERCGGFDENMPTQGFEDWDFWCRIACGGGKFYHVNEVLYEYRVRKDSMSVGMATVGRTAAIMRHMHAKRIDITMGNYVNAHQSWDACVEQFRGRPAKTLAILLARAYCPGLYSRWQTHWHKS
jgi:glycosyltransferase involved in cell wall biosynthesis